MRVSCAPFWRPSRKLIASSSSPHATVFRGEQEHSEKEFNWGMYVAKMAQHALAATAFEVDPETPRARRMDSTPRRSIAENGKTIVVALCPSTFWEKQLHYVCKFLVRSTRDRVILLYFVGSKGADAMPGLLEKAKQRVVSRSRLSDHNVETDIRSLSKHSVHGSIAKFCQEVQADILVLGAKIPDQNHGLFHFHRHDHIEEHCRHALAKTRVVHVEPPCASLKVG